MVKPSCQVCGTKIDDDNRGVFFTEIFPVCSKCCKPENTYLFHTACMVKADFDFTKYFELLFNATIDYSLHRKKKRYKHLYTNLSLERQLLIDEIERGSRILEVGCGWGFDGKLIAHKRPDIDYVGIDISETAVLHARSLGLNALVMSASDIRLPVGFDCAFSFDTVEHIQNIVGHFAQVNRILKPGGFYYFEYPNKYVYPNPFFRRYWLAEFLKRPCKERLYNIIKPRKWRGHALTWLSHPSFLSIDELIPLLKALNFRIEYILGINNVPLKLLYRLPMIQYLLKKVFSNELSFRAFCSRLSLRTASSFIIKAVKVNENLIDIKYIRSD